MTPKEFIEESEIWVQEGFPITHVTRALEVSRSLYYYHQDDEETTKKQGRPCPGYSINKTGDRVSDDQIAEWLTEAMEGDAGVYGYRKLTHYLRVEHQLVINPKKVYRLCKQLELLLPKRKASAYPRRLAKQHIIDAPNQLWQLDIKYGSIQESGRFFFLASAIDVFDRCIVGYYHGATCKVEHITNMLQEAIIRREIHLPDEENEHSLIIRTDNGPQFISHAFGEFCQLHGIYHERIPPKSPNLNAFIESFHSIIERECYQRYLFECYDEAYLRIDEFMDFYNHRRYHGSLSYLPPSKFHHIYKEIGDVSGMAISL